MILVTTMIKVLPSVTDRSATTIKAVPMDLASNLHRELADLTRPDECSHLMSHCHRFTQLNIGGAQRL